MIKLFPNIQFSLPSNYIYKELIIFIQTSNVQHSHSHQYQHTPCEDLSPNAFLNIAADKLATEYLVTQSPAEWSMLFPATQVNLEFPNCHHNLPFSISGTLLCLAQTVLELPNQA